MQLLNLLAHGRSGLRRGGVAQDRSAGVYPKLHRGGSQHTHWRLNMAILAIFTGNISKSQYEAARKEIDWEGQQPQGGIVHVASFDNSDRIHVADVWESVDAMNAFVEQRLIPAFKKLGITPPEVAVYPVHNLNAYKSIDKHKI
jgi:hypothetical protein